jgi:hypothetical protein
MPRIPDTWLSLWVTTAAGRARPEIEILKIINNGKQTMKRSYEILNGQVGDTRYAMRDRNGRLYADVDFADGSHRYA